jgi:hypothetical protein
VHRRRKLAFAAAVVVTAVVCTAAYGAIPSKSGTRDARAPHARTATAADNSVVGAWHVTVYVAGSPPPAPFDTLYLFNGDGGFSRIDGRNDVPALGAWDQSTEGRVSSTFMLFSFDAAGHRVGTITATTLGRVRDGVLSGSFTANGVDLAGNTLPGFPKTGTFTGTRIQAPAP